MTEKEKRVSKKKTPLPVSQFEYEMFDDKFYIIRNFSKDTCILPGTEVVDIAGISPFQIIDKYTPTNTYNGYNRNFQKHLSVYVFPSFYYYENEKLDSVNMKLRYNGSIFFKTIKRDSLVVAKVDKETKKKRRIQGFNKDAKQNIRELKFLTPDSTIALMTLRNFRYGNYRKFYKESSKTIKSAGTKNLIIDLRNNTGGNLVDTQHLFSYFADSTFHFVNQPEITSPFSPTYAQYNSIKRSPLIYKFISVFFLPSNILSSGIRLARTKRLSNGNYAMPEFKKVVKPNKTDIQAKYI